MASSTLLQRLQAELKREGKKTAVLALLLLVGLWFWLPPLYHRLFHSAQAETPASTQKSRRPASGKSASQSAEKQTEKDNEAAAATDWRVRRERLDNLAILQPADWNEQLRDPFSSDWIDQQVAERKQAAKTKPALNLNKVKVSSTVVGPGISAAIINDQIYKVGDRFPHKPIQGLPTLTVVDIQADCVVFEYEGKRYTVRLEGKD